MEAPVVAVAMLMKTADDPEDPVEPPGPVVPPTVIEKIETARNKNVIVGNWEVQNYYRYLTNGSNDEYVEPTTTDSGDSKSDDSKSDSSKSPAAIAAAKKVNGNFSRAGAFYARFGYDVYTDA